jgi:hypothetical protein
MGCAVKELIPSLEAVPVPRAVLVLQAAFARGNPTPCLRHFIGQAHQWYIFHLQQIAIDHLYRRILSSSLSLKSNLEKR